MKAGLGETADAAYIASAAPPPRQYFCDVLRVVAMYSIILLHVSAQICVLPATAPGWHGAVLLNAATRWAVPVFVMLSGYLLLGKEEPLGSFLKRRAGRVLLPGCVWIGIGMLLLLLHGQGWQTTLAMAASFGGAFYHFWFVFMIFGLYLLVPFLSQCRSLADSVGWYLLIVMALFSLAWTLNSSFGGFCGTVLQMMGQCSIFVGYFLLGHFLPRLNIPVGLDRLLRYGCPLMWLVTTCGTVLLVRQTGRWNEVLLGSASFPVLAMAVGVFLWGLHGRTHWQPMRPGACRIWLELSMISYGIFLMHTLVLAFLAKIWLNNQYDRFNAGWVMLGLMVGCGVISTVGALVLSRIPGIRRLTT